jgi:Na+/melibiose symporter-like transporter
MVRYRCSAYQRGLLVVGPPAVLLVGAVALVAAYFDRNALSLVEFVLFWGVVSVAGIYISYTKIVHELVLEGDVVNWKAVARAGSVQVTDIIAFRANPDADEGWNTAFVVLRGRRSLRVLLRKGFKTFVDAVVARNPSVQVDLTTKVRFRDKLPGPSGCSRD